MYVFLHRVKNIYLLVHTATQSVRILKRIFESQTLEELYLSIHDINGRFNLLTTNQVSLPKLEKNHLVHTSINQNTMTKLLQGSPVLTWLELEDCVLSMNGLNSDILEILRIESCLFEPQSNGNNFSINTPNLDYMYINGTVNGRLILGNMPNLDRAFFSAHAVSNFIEVVGNVSQLELCYHDPLNNMIKNTPNMPIFQNLKTLTFKYTCVICWLFKISNFVRNCPNLEVLILRHGVCKTYNSHVSHFLSSIFFVNYF